MVRKAKLFEGKQEELGILSVEFAPSSINPVVLVPGVWTPGLCTAGLLPAGSALSYTFLGNQGMKDRERKVVTCMDLAMIRSWDIARSHRKSF